MLKIAKNGLILHQGGSYGFSQIFFCKSPPSDFVPVGDRRGLKILSPPHQKFREKNPDTWRHVHMYRPFLHCSDQAGLGAFTAKSGRKHYNPPPLTVMWMNFDSPNFPSFCSLSAIISFQTCSNKCILYVLSFHKCIKIKYKMVNMYGVFRD